MKRILWIMAFGLLLMVAAGGGALADECAGGSAECSPGGAVVSCPTSGTNVFCNSSQICICRCVTINGQQTGVNKCIKKNSLSINDIDIDDNYVGDLQVDYLD